MYKFKKSLVSLMMAGAVVTSTFDMSSIVANAEPVEASANKIYGYDDAGAQLKMELYARYNSGNMNEDGGCMEIIEYNSVNGYAYAVSGVDAAIVSIKLGGVTNGESVAELTGTKVDVKSLVETAEGIEGFIYGDTTSVAISPDGTKLAAAIQHKDYDKAGVVAVFDCNEDGSISNPKLYATGVQPDMVTFAGESTVLTADEGEPRNGYGEGTVDPEGTVSVVDISKGTSKQVGFKNFTADELVSKNIIVGVVNGEKLNPEFDMEPEYIAVASDGKTAYVALQEANAIAVLDLSLEEPAFTGIYSTGYEDFSEVKVDINKKDEKYAPDNYENIVGARMPDGISIYESNGNVYIIAANEGDSRDWEDYCNEYEDASKTIVKGKLVFLDDEKCAGLPDGKKVMFGGRSFTIFQVTESGLTQVFDSADDFERITAEKVPDNFNCSNDDKTIDDRSGKKGPEPENVTIGTIGERTYAFIAIERVSGIMVYDITNPAEAKYVNYINSRDFSDDVKGDVSPEGICFVQDHGNGKAAIVVACEVSGTVAAYELTDKDEAANAENIVVLYTNDVHNGYVKDKDTLGYAALVAYKKQLESAGFKVTLIDGGDSIQGGVIGTLSEGKYIAEIMDNVGYDIAVPGNHEFDFGLDTLLDIDDEFDYEYISCNFIDLGTGKTVFDAYKTVDCNGKKVAYVGITTPETFFKSTPSYFQDENGNYIYGFCEGNNGKDLYAQVQKSIDKAKAEGADYVVAVGHIGTDSSSSPWTSKEIIANTSGIDAFLDGHLHSVIDGENVKNKDGKDVVLCSAGTKLNNIAKLVIGKTGITTKLIDEVPSEDMKTLNFVNDITKQFDELQNKVVAKTEVNLIINDPETGDRIIRNQETNLGDLCADAYRNILGADIAFVNGGGIRVNINKGDINYGNIVSVHPFGNMACLVEATGQQILDALELGSRYAGTGESGGFLQVSGLTYQIDTSIPSSVVCDDKGGFVKVDGEYRVKNVIVGGEPLDLGKTYKLASHNYMLKSGGDGYTMFKNDKILLDEVKVDNQVLIDYIVNELGGEIKEDSIYALPYGEERIQVIIAYKAPTDTEDGYMDILQGKNVIRKTVTTESMTGETPNTGDGVMIWLYVAMLVASFGALAVFRKTQRA